MKAAKQHYDSLSFFDRQITIDFFRALNITSCGGRGA